MTPAELHAAVLADPPFVDPRLVTVPEQVVSPSYRYLAKLTRRLAPRVVVELGTGAGRTAAMIAAALTRGSTFATVNWPNPPSGDDVGRELRAFFAGGHATMKRIQDSLTREEFVRHYSATMISTITQFYGDTRDPSVVEHVPDGINLLYVDSGTTHEYALVSVEWELYRPKLADGAIVVFDDVRFPASDMERFWEPVKERYGGVEIDLCGHAAGMVRYTR